jgi:hypothetical protein
MGLFEKWGNCPYGNSYSTATVQNHAEWASVKNWDDMAPALMLFATAPAALGDFDIADSERVHE